MTDTVPNPDDDGIERGPDYIPSGIRNFPISPDDLTELERLCSDVLDSWIFAVGTNPKNRLTYNRIKGILSDVRFRYGPPTYIETIPAGPEP